MLNCNIYEICKVLLMFFIPKNPKTIKIKTFQHFNVNSVVHKTIGRGYCCRYFQLIIQEVSILKRQLIDIFFFSNKLWYIFDWPKWHCEVI